MLVLCLFGVEIKVGQLRNPFPGFSCVINIYSNVATCVKCVSIFYRYTSKVTAKVMLGVLLENSLCQEGFCHPHDIASGESPV